MKHEEELVKIFSGSEIAVNLLKAELEEIGIPALIKNDFRSGIVAGFPGGMPSANDLYVYGSDKKSAEPLVNEFRKNNQ